MQFTIGDLVEDHSEQHFRGIGKLESINEVEGIGTVSFFSSPRNPSGRRISVNLELLDAAALYEEQIVFYFNEMTNLWRSARYFSSRPDGNHLIGFYLNQDGSFDDAKVSISEIYALNIAAGESLDPLAFAEARYIDPPFFHRVRQRSLKWYISQRASCRSISSITSSSIELVPHQLAVVRRVMQDSTKKYLLADEVGLGKTIEAGIILKELMLKDLSNQIAIVSVPAALIPQWELELKNRFHLGELIDKTLLICSHEVLAEMLAGIEPHILIIDEAHLIAPLAWSKEPERLADYRAIAKASNNAEACLLLSGTPISGNETNLLAMLHLLAPEIHEVTDIGLEKFQTRLTQRETLGGIYQALTANNDNGTISELLTTLKNLFAEDQQLAYLVDQALPNFNWMAESDSPERTSCINDVRYFVGENYRLHQRLLRNRRIDPGISELFPGYHADGAINKFWTYDSIMSIEQILDAFRAEFFFQEVEYLALNSDNFISWVKEALIAPVLVGFRAKSALLKFDGGLSSEEKSVLEELVFCSKQEQQAKDNLLLSVINDWLTDNPIRAKVIVFCTDPLVGDLVATGLKDNLSMGIERHVPGTDIQFMSDKECKVLVCDHEGEDGLNLNGGRKLLIHYSQPLSFSRIEQRIGRVNRYSEHIFAAPIQNIVLMPDGNNYSRKWQMILAEAVGIYQESVASLEYALEGQIEKAWNELTILGPRSLDNLYDLFTGSNGEVAREKRRVINQEQLNTMDADITAARDFALEVDEVDRLAEKRVKDFKKWIVKAIAFTEIEGDFPNTFRFQYNKGAGNGRRTLMDIGTLLEKCITGIDLAESDEEKIVTSMMSADRDEASHGRQVYPFRFGQPFVDAIYDAILSNARGISSAVMHGHNDQSFRYIDVYFKITHLLSGPDGAMTYAEKRILDEKFPPKVCSNWVSQSGQVVEEGSPLRQYLGAHMYSQENEKITPEHWEVLEKQGYTGALWSDLVNHVTRSALKHLNEEQTFEGYSNQLLSIYAFVMVREQ
ncbi:protein DpdE [Oceanospirillaceae bacterium]|nr:protein DpdE [Oceanospirillaceae bacterium]